MRLRPDIVRELPDERLVHIEINGCHAGTVRAVPDALPELGLGWAAMHGFLRLADVPERVTVTDDRVSIMVPREVDVDTGRLAAVGWISADPAPVETGAREPVSLTEAGLLALIDAAWSAFRHDDRGDGFQQAAIASPGDVLCIARDRSADLATAKVLGWTLTDGRDTGAAVLLVRGMVGRQIVEGAARWGLGILVSSGLPTAEAYRAAQGLPVTMIGMASARTVGVLADHGHLTGD